MYAVYETVSTVANPSDCVAARLELEAPLMSSHISGITDTIELPFAAHVSHTGY